MGSDLGGGVGGNNGFGLRDSDYHVGQGTIRNEESSFTDFTILVSPGLHQFWEAPGHGGGHWPTKEAEIAGKLGVTPVTIDGDLKEKETK